MGAEHAGLTLVVLMQVLKDEAMPKLVILPGSLISETPNQAAVLLLRKQQNATLNPQVQVVNEKPVRAQISLHKHLHHSQQGLAVKTGHMHGQYSCDTFEKFRFALLEERDWLAIVVQNICVEEVHELSELVRLILVKDSQDLLRGLVPKLSVVDHQLPQDHSRLERVLVAQVTHSVHELVQAFGCGWVQGPVEPVLTVALAQLNQTGNQLTGREVVDIFHVEEDFVPRHSFEVKEVV